MANVKTTYPRRHIGAFIFVGELLRFGCSGRPSMARFRSRSRLGLLSGRASPWCWMVVFHGLPLAGNVAGFNTFRRSFCNTLSQAGKQNRPEPSHPPGRLELECCVAMDLSFDRPLTGAQYALRRPAATSKGVQLAFAAGSMAAL